jgi:tetratricopeptide (TPR) repeat protein
MAKKEIDHTEESFANVEEAIGKTEQFVENNKNILSYSVLGLFAIVLLIMGYNKYIRVPNQEEAYSTIWHAEQYFDNDNFNFALNGNDDKPGFLEIIDNYGSTPSGNLARYYAGICYFKMAQADTSGMKEEYYEDAIDYLNDFESEDVNIKPMSIGVIGDCEMELGNQKEAASKYMEAAHLQDNNFISPMMLKKAGMTYHLLGEHEKALQAFNEIKEKYYRSAEGNEIKKYIAREEALLGN